MRASARTGTAPGQTHPAGQGGIDPGCRDSYGHIQARPTPPTGPDESGWLQGELLPIFCRPAVWRLGEPPADIDSNDGGGPQEGAGELQPASVGQAHPDRPVALSGGLAA
jgi:hypothetical protein